MREVKVSVMKGAPIEYPRGYEKVHRKFAYIVQRGYMEQYALISIPHEKKQNPHSLQVEAGKSLQQKPSAFPRMGSQTFLLV